MAKWLLGLTATTALFPVAALAAGNGDAIAAQPASQPEAEAAQPADQQSGEIIVTAQRYNQRLQDVPLSVSAVSAEELQARNVTTLSALQYSVPGLSTYEYGVGQSFVQLRGVSNQLGSSTVGIYLDETPMTLDRQGNAVDIRLVDMERVEVLRGPQATLYGEGSMGGTIRYIPAAPRLDAFSGSAEAQYSTTEDGADGYRIVGVLNIPIATDRAGLRLVGSHERVGGFIDSAVTGRRDVDSADVTTLRGTLLLRPSDRLSFSLLGLYQKIEQDYQAFGNDRVTTAVVPTFNEDEYYLIQARAEYDLDFATLSGSASYINRDNTIQADLSPFYVPALPLFGFPVGLVTSVANPNRYQYDVYNAELRLASQGEGPFRWSLGATYRDLNLDFNSNTITAPGSLPFTLLSLSQQVHTKSYALYGEASYAITPQLTFTAGLRYFNQDLSQISLQQSFGTVANDIGNGTFDSFNPRFNLAYNFDRNSMIYVNIAKGFRAGGFNLTSAGGGVVQIPPTFSPDSIWTYEFGTKHQLFDNRLTFEASVYRSDWSDVQSYSFAPGSSIVVITNSGTVSGWGVDLAVSARPARGLTLTGSYSWNNLEFQDATGDKLPGDPVDGAVGETYSASLDYRVPIGNNVDGFFRVDYQHAARSQITLRNFGQIVERPGRDLVNLRVGADIGPVQLSVYAENLFDEDAPIIIGPFGVFAESVEQRPRVIGVSARFGF